MKLLDAWRFYAAFEDVKEQIADLAGLEVGDSQKVYIPEAKDLSALLVRGKDGRRIRITGVIVHRER